MQEDTRSSKQPWKIWVTIALTFAALIIGILTNRKRRASRKARVREQIQPRRLIPDHIQGLSEAEAAARQLQGQDNTIEFKPRRTRNKIFREVTLTIFNLDLLGLATAQFILGKPLDALISLGVMCLNIGLNIAQELLAMKRLAQIEQTARVKATVIREGKLRSIDPNEVVLDDVLVVGPGDFLLADGEIIGNDEIVLDESMFSGKDRHVTKREGDMVYAGSFSLSGRTAYQVKKVGRDRRVARITEQAQNAPEELTPLQKTIAGLLQVMLIIVIIMITVLLLNSFQNDLVALDVYYLNAASLIFSLAPSGLFFMIIVGYAAGTADIAKIGALVHRAQSVETLSQINVLCLSKAGPLTGVQVEIDPIQPSKGQSVLAERRIQQILGDYARSISTGGVVSNALIEGFEGDRRKILEEAPFLSAYGWSGITFDDNDLRGTFILGAEPVLQPYLDTKRGEDSTQVDQNDIKVSGWRSLLKNAGGIFGRLRGTPTTQDIHTAEDKSPGPEQGEVNGNSYNIKKIQTSSDQPIGKEENTDNIFKRWGKRVREMLTKSKTEAQPGEETIKREPTQVFLIFAYRPDPVELHDATGEPQLSPGLIPLCNLSYTEFIRPDIKETLHAFSKTGVDIKILSSDQTDAVTALARKLGISEADKKPLKSTSGPELSHMSAVEFDQRVKDTTVYGQLTPEQKARVIQSLRKQKAYVAMVGHGATDVPALQQANLAITSRSGSQAAISVADIVLLKHSPKILLDVLDKGQRILNGLLDVLKLYLTQIFYLAISIVTIRLVSFGLPYHPSQGSVIALLTLTIPAVVLSLLARPGVFPVAEIRKRLGHFVIPAAGTISIALLITHTYFLLSTSDMFYTNLVVTYTLLGIGFVLVLFVKPPSKAFANGNPYSGDRRMVWVELVAGVIFYIMLQIPLARESFRIDLLREPIHYLIVGLVVLLWAMALRIIWWVWSFDKKPDESASVAK